MSNEIYNTLNNKDRNLLEIILFTSEGYLVRPDISQPELVALKWNLTRILEDHGVCLTIVWAIVLVR